MRLDSQDSLGQHTHLPSLLILTKQYNNALSISQAWIRDEQAYINVEAPLPPSWIPLATEEVENYSTGYSKAEWFYSAAIAAFKVRGDCMTARQYLHIGARLNPHILLRVLVKVERPRTCSFTVVGRL